MALTTYGHMMELREQILRDIERSFFLDLQTTTVAEPPKPLTQDDIRGWIADLGKLRTKHIAPTAFIVHDAQQQRRTPIIDWYYERPEKLRTKTRKQGRKCSRRKWKAMNRRQWVARPIYAEPDDVLQFQGKTLVTPRQYQALVDATIRVNSTG